MECHRRPRLHGTGGRDVFHADLDATRVRIILALQETELSVGDLAEVVDKSPAAVSQHLAKLRLAKMMATRQEGRRVFYRLANEHACQLVTDALFQAEHAVEAEPRHRRQSPPPPVTQLRNQAES